MEEYTIAIDFDGTVVSNKYPEVGNDIGAVPVLRCLINNGARLLLCTMRSRNNDGQDTLQPALDWFEKNHLPLWNINNNPEQTEWTDSSKIFASLYIDDTALAAPLMFGQDGTPHLDWSLASVYLYAEGLLTDNDIIMLESEGSIREEHFREITKLLKN